VLKGNGFYERTDEINGHVLEASLAISNSFSCSMGPENKNGRLEKTINTPRLLQPSGEHLEAESPLRRGSLSYKYRG
jgi:hypothetical protein